MKPQGHLLTALPLVVLPMEPPAMTLLLRMQTSCRLRYSTAQQHSPLESSKIRTFHRQQRLTQAPGMQSG